MAAPPRLRVLQMRGAGPSFRRNSRGRPAVTQGNHPMEAFAQFVPLILIFVIMYFLLIRPQQKKLKEHKAMVEALRRGDQVVTQGGLIGKVSKVKDEGEIEVELAEGVKVRVVRSTISQVLSKTEPAEG
jgi:preprotein translocase subunit YajC